MNLGRRVLACIAILSVAFLSGAAEGAPAYSSAKPLYAKVALNADGSKALTVVFDESKGTGKGYDVLYADAGLSGTLDKAEKVESTTYTCPSGIHFYFPPIEVNVPYNDKGAGISGACEVTLRYEKHSSTTGTTARLLRSPSPSKTTEDFTVTTSVKLRDGSAPRQYSFTRSIKPSENRGDAPVWSFPPRPEVVITTQPDKLKEGNVGIGFDLANAEGEKGAAAGSMLQPTGCGCAGAQVRFQSNPSINAHVEVKAADGKVIHRGDAELDKFTFG